MIARRIPIGEYIDVYYTGEIATTIEQSQHLLELGLDRKTADCKWVEKDDGRSRWFDLEVGKPVTAYEIKHCPPAWSLSALLEVMPKPDLYRETADLWVCVAFFKEGSIRGFGETAIEAACDNITKMFGRGYLIKKGGEQ